MCVSVSHADAHVCLCVLRKSKSVTTDLEDMPLAVFLSCYIFCYLCSHFFCERAFLSGSCFNNLSFQSLGKSSIIFLVCLFWFWFYVVWVGGPN